MTWGLFLLCGAIGIAGMTWLFPLLARLISSGNSCPAAPEPLSGPYDTQVSVLIPVHNDEEGLRRTLSSISAALRSMQQVSPASFSILVGADCCSDNSAAAAREFGAEVIEFNSRMGKWRMLQALVDAAPKTGWIILADAGIRWPQDFLLRLAPLLSRREVMGVLPSYSREGAGIVEDAVWKFERHLKALEEKAGGPVSAHGATAAYRAAELREALRILRREEWLNDDVVLPLILRSQFPSQRILYLKSLIVSDEPGPTRGGREFARRRRMIVGNLQWIKGLYRYAVQRNRVAGLLAARRIFRLFWAYWGLMIAIGTLLLGGVPLLVTCAAAGLLLLPMLRRAPSLLAIFESACASLLTPYYWYRADSRGVVWK